MGGPINDAQLQDQNLHSDETSEGPSLTFALQEDTNHSNQLSFFRPNAPPEIVQHRSSEEHFLGEGKLARSEFSARLQRVNFGSFNGTLKTEPACLILFRVDFCPRNRSSFRFRSATVEAEFKTYRPDSATSVDEQDPYDGPIIRKFYPELIRGHVSTIADKLNFNLSVGPPAPMNMANGSATWSLTRPQESVHLIHGWLLGEPANRVKWDIKENEVNNSGIYESPKFAVIVKHTDKAMFSMVLKIKAITWGGLAVVGKNNPQIVFTPTERGNVPDGGPSESGTGITPLSVLSGGSISNNGQTWVAGSSKNLQSDDLAKVDLEDLTQMQAILLGTQAPGAQAAETSADG